MQQYKYIDLDKMEERLKELELELRDIQLSSPNYIPSSKNAYLKIYDIGREIYDITRGENAVVLNRAGQAQVAYICRNIKNRGRASHWTDFLDNATEYNSGWEKVLPCFIRNNRIDEYFAINKYQATRLNDSVNNLVGHYAMSPAHSNGGFNASYDGSIAEHDRVNALTPPTVMPDFMNDFVADQHLVTWDEWAYVLLMLKEYGFEPLGNANGGYDINGGYGQPANYVYNYTNLNRPQTLNGTGPRTWRHNGKMTGIADICGNCRDILAGTSVNSGYFEFIDFRTTSGTLTASQLNSSSNLWKRIKSTDGTFIAPADVTGDVKAYCVDFATTPTANSGTAHLISDTITHRDAGFYGYVRAESVTIKEGLRKDPKLEMLGVIPFKTSPLLGAQYMRNADGSRFIRNVGGTWYDGGIARSGYVIGDNAFGDSGVCIGVRSASRPKTLMS